MRVRQILFFLLIAVSTVFSGVTFAAAASLDSAKAEGHLGEQPNGYLGLVNPAAPPDVKSLMAEVNAKRKEQYQEIAKKNGTDIRAVESLAGKKAIQITPPGQFIHTGSGWTRK